MKLLLLGANGQLGREWQHHLEEKNQNDYHLIAYDSSQLDITQFGEVEKELNRIEPDIIINCAAYTKVDKAEQQREKAQAVNAEAVKHMAGLCEKNDVKLVHYSTDYIFAGRKEDQQKFPNGYPEKHPADPVNWYGQTKWEGEQAIRASGCRHLILRLSWVSGAYGSNFVTAMLRLAETHDKLTVVDDQFGSPAFTGNIVENTLKLIEQNLQGTYHLTGAGLISWAEFAEEIFRQSGMEVEVKPIPSDEYPTAAKRPYFSKLCTDKIEQVKGIVIEDWKTGLGNMLDKLSRKGAKPQSEK